MFSLDVNFVVQLLDVWIPSVGIQSFGILFMFCIRVVEGKAAILVQWLAFIQFFRVCSGQEVARRVASSSVDAAVVFLNCLLQVSSLGDLCFFHSFSSQFLYKRLVHSLDNAVARRMIDWSKDDGFL